MTHGSGGKESTCNAGDLGSISGSRRSPGEGSGYPLQYSCLENSMDRRAWWAYSPWGHSQTQLRDFHFYFFSLLLSKEDFPGGSHGKDSACDAGDLGSISGSRRSPGEGNRNLLQYSCLGKSMDRGA